MYNVHVFIIFCNKGYIINANIRADRISSIVANVTRTRPRRAVRIESVANAVVFPYGRQGDIGVYDGDGNFVAASSVMEKANRPHRARMPRVRDVDYIDMDVLYIGDMHWHFGHFLLEHLTRVWARAKYKKLKCVIMHKPRIDRCNVDFIYQLLRMAGIERDDLIILRRPTRFRRVFVPHPADGPDFTSDAFGKTFDMIGRDIPELAGYSRVYVSRTRLDERRTFGEEKIQNIFRKNGFRIIHPEQMSILRQIQIMRSCRVLAGCAGTALHLALFMKPGGRVIQIKRNTINTDNIASQNHINHVRGLSGIFIWASVEGCQTQHFTDAPQIIGVTEYMRAFMDDNKFKYSDADVGVDVRSMDAYTAALAAYNKTHGNKFIRRLKKLAVNISACFIPDRKMRARYRHWIKGDTGI